MPSVTVIAAWKRPKSYDDDDDDTIITTIANIYWALAVTRHSAKGSTSSLLKMDYIHVGFSYSHFTDDGAVAYRGHDLPKVTYLVNGRVEI